MKFVYASLAATLFLAACTAVPPEVTKLSSSVGEQLVKIKAAHIAQINDSFDFIEGQLSGYVDNVYAPQIVHDVLATREGDTLITVLKNGKDSDEAGKKALAFTTAFVQIVHEKVEAKRQSLLQPVRQQRAATLARTEAAWAQVIQGNTTVTTYLLSVQKLHGAQDEALKTIGIDESGNDVAQKLAGVSQELANANAKLTKGELTIETFDQQLIAAIGKLKSN